jgi:hypothetical protein
VSDPFYTLANSFSYSESASSDRIKFILTQSLFIRFKGRDFGQGRFLDQKGTVRLMCDGDCLIVTNRYGWDGASPKFKLFGKWVGAIDTEGSKVATCVHDALYQFMHLPCLKITRADADAILYGIMKQNKTIVALPYYIAVRLLGGIFYHLQDATRPPSSCFTE